MDMKKKKIMSSTTTSQVFPSHLCDYQLCNGTHLMNTKYAMVRVFMVKKSKSKQVARWLST